MVQAITQSRPNARGIYIQEIGSASREFMDAYKVIATGIPDNFLESPDFLRNRLRIKEQGPGNDKERALVRDGYNLHLIAAKDGDRVIGATLGSHIPMPGTPFGGFGFGGYISVLPEYQNRGIGTALTNAMHNLVHEDAMRFSGKPPIGFVGEVELGKQANESKGSYPLDIKYFQPAIKEGQKMEELQLTLQIGNGISAEEAKSVKLNPALVDALVRGIYEYEYVEDWEQAYKAFRDSITGKRGIGFRV